MKKEQSTFETIQENTTKTFNWIYQLITDNPIKSIATALATIFGLKKFGTLKAKFATSKKSNNDIDKQGNDKELKDVIKKIEDLLSKKKTESHKDEDDHDSGLPADLGSQATALPTARPEELDREMQREPSSLMEPQAPTQEVSITRSASDTITITLNGETITTTVTELLALIEQDSELADIITAPGETMIFSDGSIQQTVITEQAASGNDNQDRRAAEDPEHLDQRDQVEEAAIAQQPVVGETTELNT